MKKSGVYGLLSSLQLFSSAISFTHAEVPIVHIEANQDHTCQKKMIYW